VRILDDTLKEILNGKLRALEQHFQADVVFYYGEISPSVEKLFRDFIETLRAEDGGGNRLVIILNTPGGSVETVEKMVEIVRFHYEEVYFVVPDYAMSAGTVFCMSGNKIYMDYSSSLGPIDPQVFNGKEYVPALGYLDQVQKMIEKAKDNSLTHAEFLILQSLDLAMLSRYEQARNLTVTLLKKWLVEHKFTTWEKHSSNPDKIGNPVTMQEKEERAEEIATILGNNKIWHSHGRHIGVHTLRNVLKLKIEDYSADIGLRGVLRPYNDLMIEYINRAGFKLFMHSRNFF